MKFILISDIHGTSRIPKSRIDDPLKAFHEKMKWIFELSSKLDNAPIISSGDVFDSPRDLIALYKFINIKREYPETQFFTVFGQHDLYFRNKELVTNLGILSRTNMIKILDSTPYEFEQFGIHLYGCSWNDNVPKVKNKSFLNILSIHATIYTEPLFHGHEFIKVKNWQKKNDNFDLVICGDIHKNFSRDLNGKIICNTGPIMRLNSSEDMMNHKPMVYIYNSEKHNLKSKLIPCAPSKDILDTKIKIIENEIDLGSSFNFDRPTSKIDIHKIIEKLLSQANNEQEIRIFLSEISGEIGEI